MTERADRSSNAAYQAYCWARFASDPSAGERAREEGRRLSNSDPDSATDWQRWAARIPSGVSQQRAIDLALMWVRVAEVQPEPSDAPGDDA